MRIALIHALQHSPPPVAEAFARLWPEATLMNLLDDSLSVDLSRDGRITPLMSNRFLVLSQYVFATGAAGILFTCSAFGPCIDAVKVKCAGKPVLKPNEAMIDEAITYGGRIGLLATFPPTLASMPAEFPATADVRPHLAEGAMEALNRGNMAAHDALAVKAALTLKDCDVIALAQFSLARAAGPIAAATGKPVLTTPDSAVKRLKAMCLEAQPSAAA
ncbi:MAG: arylsulfatase [Beijerinckiaceae bacterium]